MASSEAVIRITLDLWYEGSNPEPLLAQVRHTLYH